MLSCDVLNILCTKRGYSYYKTVIIGYNTCTIFHSFIDKLSLTFLQHSLLTIMYEFLGLPPPTKKQKNKFRERRET